MVALYKDPQGSKVFQKTKQAVINGNQEKNHRFDDILIEMHVSTTSPSNGVLHWLRNKRVNISAYKGLPLPVSVLLCRVSCCVVPVHVMCVSCSYTYYDGDTSVIMHPQA